VVLAREQREYPARVRAALGGGRSESTPTLTVGRLDDVFAAADGRSLPDAAWLAGRSTTGRDEDLVHFAEQVRGVLGAHEVDDLRSFAASYVEAALSLALLADPDAARDALRPLISGEVASTRAYLAAAYLAQLGDPSGWPALLADLDSSSEHTRLMATRNLVSFAAFDGTRVGTHDVDVRAALVARLADDAVYVAREVPEILFDCGVADVVEILEDAAVNGQSEELRDAALVALAAHS
jgi:hypothetical protein